MVGRMNIIERSIRSMIETGRIPREEAIKWHEDVLIPAFTDWIDRCKKKEELAKMKLRIIKE